MLISFVTKFVYDPSWNNLRAFRNQRLETELVKIELREYDGTGYCHGAWQCFHNDRYSNKEY